MRALRAALARHPIVSIVVGIIVVAGAILGVVFFEPQVLFLDDRVDEGLPQSAQAQGDDEEEASTGSDADAEDTEEVDTLLTGRFRGLNHSVEGTARVIDVGEGELYLRFESFSVENGPDLKVYLSSAPADSPDDDDFARDFIDLGTLKGNIGNQNYKLPADVDLDNYRAVVVWCRRFAVGFAVAGLQ